MPQTTCSTKVCSSFSPQSHLLFCCFCDLWPLSSILSKPLPVFNRCTPVDISCYARFAEAVVTFVGDNSVLHRLIAGVAASKEIIIGLCVLALCENKHQPLRWKSNSHMEVPKTAVLLMATWGSNITFLPDFFSPLHDPHGDHSLHLCCPRLDPHLTGCPWIPWWDHFLSVGCIKGCKQMKCVWNQGFAFCV